jgi:hypothetical protein
VHADPATERSAYQSGAGTPCGKLMRRYWHPVAAVAQMKDKHTRKVRNDVREFKGAERQGSSKARVCRAGGVGADGVHVVVVRETGELGGRGLLLVGG